MPKRHYIKALQAKGPHHSIMLHQVEHIAFITPNGQQIELTITADGKVQITSNGEPPAYDKLSLQDGRRPELH